MSDIKQAAENVRALTYQFRALIGLGENLDKIADIESLAAERQKQLDSILAQIKEAEGVLAHIYDNIEYAQHAVDEYNVEALDVAFDANDYRVNVEAASIEASTIIIEQAKAEAEAINQHAAKIKAEYVDVEAKLFGQCEEYNALLTQIGETKAQLRALVS